MSFDFPKKVYFIAIAGTGMSALAGLMRERGAEVAGSDLACYPPVSELLERLGIAVHKAYDVEHLKSFDPDYVVIGNFVRKDNPQARYVIESGIPYGSFPSTLEKLFLSETRNVVVAGTHGKSTTASAIAHLLKDCGHDPSYLIGALPHNLGQSFHCSRGSIFVLEGDEYDTAFFDKESKFLHYCPELVVWTSFEFDHADIFKDLESIEVMFRKLLRLIPEDGALIFNGDWPHIREIVTDAQAKADLKCRQLISYGFNKENDHQLTNWNESSSSMSFELAGARIESLLAGRFNALNLAAAFLVAEYFRIPQDQTLVAIKSFKGVKRRQELRFEKQGRRVIDDFAHHPTAVKEVISALQLRSPEIPLVAIFEARSNTTRRKFFQKDFVEAFSQADHILLAEVFKKDALPESDRLNVNELVSDLRAQSIQASGPLSESEILAHCEALASQGPCQFLILSNGDFGGLHEKLISLLESLNFSS